MKKVEIKIVIISLTLLVSNNTQAAGFALIEQSASGMGNAYAGAAAIAEDASTIFFNPAGMTYIEGSQAVGALHLIKPSVDFNDKNSDKAFGFPVRGDEGPNAGGLAFVPNFYFMTEITPTIKVGVGVNAPFGLKTEYDDKWVGRFLANKSEIKTININPSIAFKVNDKVSLGFGVSIMRAEATLTRQVNRVVAAESDVEIKGDDFGFGFNLGAIYQATANTRIGVAYRSKVEQHLDGKAKFGATLASSRNADVKADVTLPESFSVSAFSTLNDKWDLMGDISWTRWSQFEELRIRFNDNSPDAVTPENWKNTMRYSIGVNYRYSDVLKLRVGLAYDEEAIKNEYRTARIPGNDRKWVSLGASYQMTPVSTFDIGYSHLFISDAKVDDDLSTATDGFNGRLTGDFESSVDILSLQYTHKF